MSDEHDILRVIEDDDVAPAGDEAEQAWKVAVIVYEPVRNQANFVGSGETSSQVQTKGVTAVRSPVGLNVMVFGGAASAVPLFTSVPMGVTE